MKSVKIKTTSDSEAFLSEIRCMMKKGFIPKFNEKGICFDGRFSLYYDSKCDEMIIELTGVEK